MARHETAADVARWLSTSSTLLTEGESLFIHVLPESTGAALAVIETAGSPPQPTYGAKIPSIARPNVQLMARTTAPSSGATIPYSSNARELIQVAYNRIATCVDQTIRGTYYLSMDPLQDPFQLNRDEKGRMLFVFNARCTKQPSTST